MKTLATIFLTTISLHVIAGDFGEIEIKYDEFNDTKTVLVDALENGGGYMRLLCDSDSRKPRVIVMSIAKHYYGYNHYPVQFKIDSSDTLDLKPLTLANDARIMTASDELINRLKIGNVLKVRINGNREKFVYTFDLSGSANLISKVLTNCRK